MREAIKRTIYIELLDEGTPCWRPVEAEYLGSDLYRIVGAQTRDETWAFSLGDVVRCTMKSFEAGGSEPVAFEKANL